MQLNSFLLHLLLEYRCFSDDGIIALFSPFTLWWLFNFYCFILQILIEKTPQDNFILHIYIQLFTLRMCMFVCTCLYVRVLFEMKLVRFHVKGCLSFSLT